MPVNDTHRGPATGIHRDSATLVWIVVILAGLLVLLLTTGCGGGATWGA